MNQVEDRQIDQWLRQAAGEFDFPAAPDVRRMVRERGRQPAPALPFRLEPVRVLVALLLVAALLLLVPQVRAAMLEILQTGGITIFVTEPTPQVEESPLETATPFTVTEEMDLLVPATRTSLEAAGVALGRPFMLPALPEALGAPDQVYVDDEQVAQVMIAVWLEGGEPRYTLYTITAAHFAFKQAGTVVTTEVNGVEAHWVDGPHGFTLGSSDAWTWQETGDSVLIWSSGDVTYRLEGAETLEEARQIAASLQ